MRVAAERWEIVGRSVLRWRMLPALQLLEVHRGYRAGIPKCSAAVQVLRGATLEVGAGEIVGVAGAPRSGKSTLLQVAAGLQRPDRGAIAWFGTDSRVAPRPPGIAHVPSTGVHYRFLTVREALEYYATLHELGALERGRRVGEMIERAALMDCADTRIARLTASQVHRVGLSQALVTEPRLLLLDGTLGALERDALIAVGRLLDSVADAGTAIVCAESDVDVLAMVAHRVVRLADGQIGAAVVSRPSVLEIEVPFPHGDADRLRGTVPGVGVVGDRLRVSLRDRSAEDVLAHCRSLGIDVRASSVVFAAH